MRALSADPQKRFSSAAAMAAEVRRIGALKLPLPDPARGGESPRGVRRGGEGAQSGARARRDPSECDLLPRGVRVPPSEELHRRDRGRLPKRRRRLRHVPPPVSHGGNPPDRGVPRRSSSRAARTHPQLAVVAPPAPALVPPRAVVALAPAPPARVPRAGSPRRAQTRTTRRSPRPLPLPSRHLREARACARRLQADPEKGTFRIVAGQRRSPRDRRSHFLGGLAWGRPRMPPATPDRPPAIAPALNSPRETVTEAPAAKTADPTLRPHDGDRRRTRECAPAPARRERRARRHAHSPLRRRRRSCTRPSPRAPSPPGRSVRPHTASTTLRASDHAADRTPPAPPRSARDRDRLRPPLPTGSSPRRRALCSASKLQSRFQRGQELMGKKSYGEALRRIPRVARHRREPQRAPRDRAVSPRDREAFVDAYAEFGRTSVEGEGARRPKTSATSSLYDSATTGSGPRSSRKLGFVS